MTQTSTLMRGTTRRVADFFFAPASAAPLAAFRIGVALVLLLQALALSRNLLDLYGSRGIVQWQVMDHVIHPVVPRLQWVSHLLGQFGIAESACVQGVFLVYVSALAAMLLGYRTRVAAIVAWSTHLMMKSSRRAPRSMASIHSPKSPCSIACGLRSAMSFRSTMPRAEPRVDPVPPPGWGCA